MSEWLRQHCNRMAATQQRRVYARKMQQRYNNQLKALVRNVIGFDVTLSEDERDEITDTAEECIEAVREGEALPVELEDDSADYVRESVRFTDVMREPFDSDREELEERLRSMARELPVWPWWSDIRGCSALGLGMVVGEAAEDREKYDGIGLAQFDNKSSLWHWFCVHVEKDQNGNDVRGQMANHRRRGIVFQVADPLMKQNDGRYREYYEHRKERTQERGWKKCRSHEEAVIYTGKMLLRDLLREWKRCA